MISSQLMFSSYSPTASSKKLTRSTSASSPPARGPTIPGMPTTRVCSLHSSRSLHDVPRPPLPNACSHQQIPLTSSSVASTTASPKAMSSPSSLSKPCPSEIVITPRTVHSLIRPITPGSARLPTSIFQRTRLISCFFFLLPHRSRTLYPSPIRFLTQSALLRSASDPSSPLHTDVSDAFLTAGNWQVQRICLHHVSRPTVHSPRR